MASDGRQPGSRTARAVFYIKLAAQTQDSFSSAVSQFRRKGSSFINFSSLWSQPQMRLQWALNPGKSPRWKEHADSSSCAVCLFQEAEEAQRKGRSTSGPSGAMGEAKIALCPEPRLCGEELGLSLSSGMNESGKVSGGPPAAGPAIC